MDESSACVGDETRDRYCSILRALKRGYLGDCGGLAQLGEHLLCKQGVKGSIPLISTTYGPIAQLARAHD